MYTVNIYIYIYPAEKNDMENSWYPKETNYGGFSWSTMFMLIYGRVTIHFEGGLIIKCASGPVFFLAIPAPHYICRKAANAQIL